MLRLHLPAIEIDAVRQCNLSCLGCAHSSPIAKPEIADPEAVRDDLARLSTAATVGELRVVGGEPLLHPDLAFLLRCIREAGIGGTVRVITNGTLISRTDREWIAFVDEIHVSRYPQVGLAEDDLLDLQEHCRARGKVLRINEYERFRLGRPASPLSHGQARSVFETCQMAHAWSCHTVHAGHVYMCPPSVAAASEERCAILPLEGLPRRLCAFLSREEPLKACVDCLGTAGNLVRHRQVPRREWATSSRQGRIDETHLAAIRLNEGAHNGCIVVSEPSTLLGPRSGDVRGRKVGCAEGPTAAPEPKSIGGCMSAGLGLPDAPPWVGETGLDAAYHAGLTHAAEARPPRLLSVVVPSWNSEESLPACLSSIARAAEAISRHCDVEIIVVDDESRALVSDILPLNLGKGVRVVRVEHGGQSRACNTGAALAAGEVLVFCDSDMALNQWSLDALVRVLSEYPDSLCFGFRQQARRDDPRLAVSAITHGDGLDDPFYLEDDNRFRFHVPGFPASLFSSTRQLRDLTHFRQVRPPGDSPWWLSRMAYGCLLACHRQGFLDIGGFDGRFVNWGYGDTELSSRWIASGRPIMPVFAANGLHLSHKARHPLQWRQHAAESRALFETLLSEGWQRVALACSGVTSDRMLMTRSRPAPVPAARLEGPGVAKKAAAMGDVGLFEQAVGLRASEGVRAREWTGTALRALRLSNSEEYFEQASVIGGRWSPSAAFEIGLLALSIGETEHAHRHLSLATGGPDWHDSASAGYLLRRQASRQFETAETHLRAGLARAAASGYLGCLIAPGGERYRRASNRALGEIAGSERRMN